MERNMVQRVLFFLGFDDQVLTVKNIARIAVLVALAAILKTYLNLDLGIWRLTFYGIPLIILGIFIGPLAAIIGGLGADFAYIMYKGWFYGINIFTLSAVLWGLIPAMFLFRRRYSVRKLVIVVVFTSTIVFLINTIGLVQFFGDTQLVLLQDGIPGPLFPRIATYLLKLPVQIYFIHHIVSRLSEAFPELELVKE